MSKQFTLGKKERLKSRKQIERLFKEGKKFVVAPYRVYYSTDEMYDIQHSAFRIQAGVGVSNKHFKRAVDRNRIKRLTKEAWRLQNAPLKEKLKASGKQMSVFLIYTGKELPDFNLVKDKVAIALKRLTGKTNENSSSAS